MTERSIFTGRTPRVVIRSGGDVEVKGWEGDRVLAESRGIWGLQVKRTKVAIEVQIGGSCQVLVPHGSYIQVYSGKSSKIQECQGTLSVVAGQDILITQSGVLLQASAGRAMDVDCRMVEGNEPKFSAGWHLRWWIRELKDAAYLIDDLGGKWQAIIGSGGSPIRLTAGGDVTLVTDQPFAGRSPEDILGKVERPIV
jgi:hypothetical protein